MHTLEQLKNGQLKGVTRLTISQQLTEFPLEILQLADTLEILDLSNNQLSDFPSEISQLINLKILFASQNKFTHIPEVLGTCPKLEMIGFKDNQISDISDASLPAQLRWLILTDNEIETLPNSLGERPRLQKLALAGNKITHLPESVSQLSNLELIRLSANQLTEFPQQLLSLPRLAWLAFAGNPFCQNHELESQVPQVASSSYKLNQVLGQGASGIISHADWLNDDYDFPEHVAVKVFKGAVTSDGYPQDELHACLQTGFHANLVKSIAQVSEKDYLALVMELIPENYFNLGLAPSLQSCTRDTFKPEFTLGIAEIKAIVLQMIDVFNHLHANKVCHGDLYAHNVLINSDNHMIFGDFGAASTYDYLPSHQQEKIKAIESRALSFFIDDLLSICEPVDIDSDAYQAIKHIAEEAFNH
ncbi:leucine-rich repeat-containing serine/threonine-protein kinase [Vibrio sp. ZSDE26]|uniref:Leucine-rich repeat-containing serine/threonine-protein kinase n=1 Tax=Vibrio amylolyticus TaxID=2847292 RepID=A0A9X1XEY4_9VIBR|nr:leucine-rich repeat-containing protein kinase family protein [Vibrio amylolyticus]MCK6261767.1 leucine-rich repeat-containing serine/threonine-protein kinase [Vibrio amylolyticus]